MSKVVAKTGVKLRRVPVEKPKLNDKRTAKALYGGTEETAPATAAKKTSVSILDRLYGPT